MKNRIIAIALGVILIFPYITWAFEIQALPQPATIRFENQSINIPSDLATVEAFYQGQGPCIIHIQDLHCHYEVQTKISRLIGWLAQHHGLKLVGIEGASRPVNVTKLSSFPAHDVKKRVADYFVRQGKISGAELYAATGELPVFLAGIENADHYAQARRLVNSFLNDESQGCVLDLYDRMSILKIRLYSKALLDFDQGESAYRQGTLTREQYASHLERWRKKTRIQSEDSRQVSAYLAAKPAGKAMLDARGIDQALEDLNRLIRNRLYTSPDQQALDTQLCRLGILEKIVNISATPLEVAEFQARPADFTVKAFDAFLRQHGAEALEPELAVLDTYLGQANDFYRLADQRSQDFIANLLQRMQAQKTGLSVLITGGYHTQHVLDQLQAAGVSYLSLQPQLSRNDWVNPYFSLLRGQRSPLEKLLAQDQRIMSLQPFFAEFENIHAHIAERDLPEEVRVGYRLLVTVLKLDLAHRLYQQGFSQAQEWAAAFERELGDYQRENPGMMPQLSQAIRAGGRVMVPFAGQEIFADFGPQGQAGDSLSVIPLAGYDLAFYANDSKNRAWEQRAAQLRTQDQQVSTTGGVVSTLVQAFVPAGIVLSESAVWLADHPASRSRLGLRQVTAWTQRLWQLGPALQRVASWLDARLGLNRVTWKTEWLMPASALALVLGLAWAVLPNDQGGVWNLGFSAVLLAGRQQKKTSYFARLDHPDSSGDTIEIPYTADELDPEAVQSRQQLVGWLQDNPVRAAQYALENQLEIISLENRSAAYLHDVGKLMDAFGGLQLGQIFTPDMNSWAQADAQFKLVLQAWRTIQTLLEISAGIEKKMQDGRAGYEKHLAPLNSGISNPAFNKIIQWILVQENRHSWNQDQWHSLMGVLFGVAYIDLADQARSFSEAYTVFYQELLQPQYADNRKLLNISPILLKAQGQALMMAEVFSLPEIFSLPEPEEPIADLRHLWGMAKIHSDALKKAGGIKNLGIDLEIAEPDPEFFTQPHWVRGDLGRLFYLVLRNLVTNAMVAVDKRLSDLPSEERKAAALNMKIQIKFFANRIEVIDQGNGISSEQFQTMFEKGVSGSQSTGLGLHTVALKARQYKLHYDYSSRADSGTRVTMYFDSPTRDEVNARLNSASALDRYKTFFKDLLADREPQQRAVGQVLLPLLTAMSGLAIGSLVVAVFIGNQPVWSLPVVVTALSLGAGILGHSFSSRRWSQAVITWIKQLNQPAQPKNRHASFSGMAENLQKDQVLQPKDAVFGQPLNRAKTAAWSSLFHWYRVLGPLAAVQPDFIQRPLRRLIVSLDPARYLKEALAAAQAAAPEAARVSQLSLALGDPETGVAKAWQALVQQPTTPKVQALDQALLEFFGGVQDPFLRTAEIFFITEFARSLGLSPMRANAIIYEGEQGDSASVAVPDTWLHEPELLRLLHRQLFKTPFHPPERWQRQMDRAPWRRRIGQAA